MAASDDKEYKPLCPGSWDCGNCAEQEQCWGWVLEDATTIRTKADLLEMLYGREEREQYEQHLKDEAWVSDDESSRVHSHKHG